MAISVRDALAFSEHTRVLAFLQDNMHMLGIEDIFFSAMEGTLFECGVYKRSPDLVFIHEHNPRHWYSIELKNGRATWNLENQIRNTKKILLRAALNPTMMKVTHHPAQGEYCYSVGLDTEPKPIIQSVPSVLEESLRNFAYEAPNNDREKRIMNFKKYPELLGIPQFLYSATHARLYAGGTVESSPDLVFVDAKDTFHWYIVNLREKPSDESIRAQMRRAKRILRENGIRATTIGIYYTPSTGYDLLIDGSGRVRFSEAQVQDYVREQDQLRLERRLRKTG